MIPDIGYFSLILVLLLSAAQTIAPFLQKDTGAALSATLARTVFMFSLLSLLTLVFSYTVSDFSVLNVVQNSHTDKPLFYKISGTWSNHEGSMILWITFLSFTGALFSLQKNALSQNFLCYTLAILGGIILLFTAFTLFTSNPFIRLFPPTLNGLGLNPLLQHPALAIHPPLLYLGYVGFGLVFAMTLSALLSNITAKEWAQAVRPWVLGSWTLLGAGTALGSWWAYAELGWGGWWFWDPVENAALMPWLTATALIHSLIAVQKKNKMIGWSLFLAILTFVLVVMGFFLVRSGLLTSVHSFANSPERGLFILFILAVIGICGFTVLLCRYNKMPLTQPSLSSSSLSSFHVISREGALLLASAFLFSGFATVFIGTLYPLLIESLQLSPVSVGPPFYHRTFVPIILPALLAIPIAPYLAWQKGSFKKSFQIVISSAVMALAGGLLALFLIESTPFLSFLGIAAGVWIMSGGAMPALRFVFLHKTLRIPLSSLGLALAHGGVGLAIIAITGSSLWQTETIRSMRYNEPQTFTKEEVILQKIEKHEGPNYTEHRAVIKVGKDTILTPSRRLYTTHPPKETSEAGIVTTVFADWFAAIGMPASEAHTYYAVHFRYIPMMLWLWISFILITIGGIVSTVAKRQNQKRSTYESIQKRKKV